MSNKVKVILFLLVVIIAISAVFHFTNFDQVKDKEVKDDQPQQAILQNTIIYFPADFSENIYNDEKFVELMNLYALKYIEGDAEYTLLESDLEKYGGKLALFFYQYFTDIRNGDVEAYNSYFDEHVFNYREKAQEFTMQQIYDISIEKLSIKPQLEEEYKWVEEEGIEPIYVDVRYKIRRNNGTFRLGVESDSVKPQLYILYEKDNTYKIINIVDYVKVHQ